MLATLLAKGKAVKMMNLLERHSIQAKYRVNMVDWMVEVLNIFDQGMSTVFKAISILDHFFLNSKQRLNLNDLHLFGATSMMMASKYESVRPITVDNFTVKICKCKYSKDDILNAEIQIFSSLEFNLQRPTIQEIIKSIVFVLNYEKQTHEEFINRTAAVFALMSQFSVDILQHYSLADLAIVCIYLANQMLRKADPEFNSE